MGDLKNISYTCGGRISSDYYLGSDLQHLKKVFHEQNDYPIWVINNVFIKFKVSKMKPLLLPLVMKNKITT